MNVHLVGNNWGSFDWSMYIVREELWAANGSHAYVVNVSAGQVVMRSPLLLFMLSGMDVRGRSIGVCVCVKKVMKEKKKKKKKRVEKKVMRKRKKKKRKRVMRKEKERVEFEYENKVSSDS